MLVSVSNADLFWALRGAGHNFGIVTSIKLRTYPIPSTYSLYTLTYTKEEIDAVFSLVNDIDFPPSTRDPIFFLNAWLIRPSPEQVPLFIDSLAYEGSSADLELRAAPFISLGPTAATIQTDITYAQIHKSLGFGIDIFACQKNTNQGISGVSLPRWNLAGLHKTYDLLSAITADPRFSNSAVLLENYGIVAVTGVDSKSMALAPEERERPLLTTAVIHFEGDQEGTRRDAA